MADAVYLSKYLRELDARELWRGYHLNPQDGLKQSFKKSLVALTVEMDLNPIAMFGISNEHLIGDKALIWLMASDKLNEIQRRFLRHSREFVDMLLEYYPTLYNWVDIDNKDSIKWLNWLGAQFNSPAPYGVERCLFRYFEFRRKNEPNTEKK